VKNHVRKDISNDNFFPKYGILVATKNRPKEIYYFLESVRNLSILPSEIVISSSGENISYILKKFTGLLKITHVHSEISGQVHQKKIGLKNFKQTLEWIAFFDDDIILMPDSIENIFCDINSLPNADKVVGVGFSDGGFVHPKNSKMHDFFSKIFFSSQSVKGRVNKSGYNTSYMGVEKILETNWLNGASIWKSDHALSYNVKLDTVPHAISEDLIFSYRINKRGTLIFSPGSKFIFQNSSKKNSSLDFYQTQLYTQFYFVLLNPELSVFAFYWRILGNSVYYLFLAREKQLNLKEILNCIYKTLSDIFMLIIKNSTSEYVLKNRIK